MTGDMGGIGGKGVYHALACQRETNAINLKTLQSKRIVNSKFHQKNQRNWEIR